MRKVSDPLGPSVILADADECMDLCPDVGVLKKSVFNMKPIFYGTTKYFTCSNALCLACGLSNAKTDSKNLRVRISARTRIRTGHR